MHGKRETGEKGRRLSNTDRRTGRTTVSEGNSRNRTGAGNRAEAVRRARSRRAAAGPERSRENGQTREEAVRQAGKPAAGRRAGKTAAVRKTGKEAAARRMDKPAAVRRMEEPVAVRRTKEPAAGRRDRGSFSRSPRKRSRKSRNRYIVLIVLLLVLLCVLFVFPGVLRTRKAGGGKDTVPPVIDLTYKTNYIVYPGQEYAEEGYSASDDRDGDLTEQVVRTVEDDTICYKVTDAAGNTSVRYRQIPYAEVSANILQEGETAEDLAKMRESFPDADTDQAGTNQTETGKIVYLTFDDGPGPYTEQLLDTLDRYGVHVTFFVTGAFPVYENYIRKEYEAGHSVGIHTFSHDFDKIYADTDAFWDDIGQMQEIIVRQTGHPTNLMRFAGGSSNTAGTWQAPGIMELLAKQAGQKGFQYFDWNVSSGDGGTYGDSAMVISRITEQIQNYDTSVVLCHDTKDYTVNAMEYLIPWLLDNGYEIRPLSVDSFPAHHMEPD